MFFSNFLGDHNFFRNKYSDKTRAFLAAILTLVITVPVFAEDTTSVLVDIQPPEIVIIKPLEGEVVTDTRSWLEIEVTDNDSGINKDSLILSLDDKDVTTSSLMERNDLQDIGIAKKWRIRYQPPLDLIPGKHRVQVSIADTIGNLAKRQWNFIIQAETSSVHWQSSLTNTLDYSYLPLNKLHDNINFTSQLQYEKQRFTLQLQAGAADYPSLANYTRWGGYYLYLDQYNLGWQSERFNLMYGDVNIPLDSSLMNFGAGFKGIYLDNNANQLSSSYQWSIFKGRSANSSGFAISLLDSTGFVCQWQTQASEIQAFLLQLHQTNQYTVLGLRDDRLFNQGILRYELIYGLEDEGDNGIGVNLESGFNFAGIYWDANIIFVQDSYPLLSTTPLSSTDGGAYQYTIRGNWLWQPQKQINFTYAHLQDNLNHSQEYTQNSGSFSVDYTNEFEPDYKLLFGYQNGLKEGFTKSSQQMVKLGIDRGIKDTNWNSTLVWQGNNTLNTGTAGQYQWNLSRTKPYTEQKLKTTALLQYTMENKVNEEKNTGMEIRTTIEKQMLQELAKSYLVISYKLNNAENELHETTDTTSLNFEGTLNLHLGAADVLTLGGKVSFWRRTSTLTTNGQDYVLHLTWQRRFF